MKFKTTVSERYNNNFVTIRYEYQNICVYLLSVVKVKLTHHKESCIISNSNKEATKKPVIEGKSLSFQPSRRGSSGDILYCCGYSS